MPKPTHKLARPYVSTDITGRAAYIAYCDFRDWKSFNGDKLPSWDKLKEDIREGWRLAADAAVFTYLTGTKPQLPDHPGQTRLF